MSLIFQGYNSSQEYIATQGPLPETRNDFWKMVLQQKSQIIVMLTQCNEKRRVSASRGCPHSAAKPTPAAVLNSVLTVHQKQSLRHVSPHSGHLQFLKHYGSAGFIPSPTCLFEDVVLFPRQVKCDHYWPFTEEPIAYGDITVEMISEEEQDDWACRHFRINYVSHQAQLWCCPQAEGAPSCWKTTPPSYKIMSTLGFATLLPLREEAPFSCPHFAENGRDDVAGGPAETAGNTALFRHRLVQGSRRSESRCSPGLTEEGRVLATYSNHM